MQQAIIPCIISTCTAENRQAKAESPLVKYLTKHVVPLATMSPLSVAQLRDILPQFLIERMAGKRGNVA